MKILQINCVYNTGSTGKITADLHNGLLENNIESVVCYGRGNKVNEPNVYKTCGEAYAKLNNLISRFTGIMYGGCFFSTNKLIKIIKKQKPDIVHLQCINGYFVNIYRLLTWLAKHGIKTVLTLHAEFMFTANCGHAFDCDNWKTGCGNCPKAKKETKSLLLDNTAASWKKMKKAFDGFKKENLIIASVSPWLMERAQAAPIFGDKRHTVVMNGLDTAVFHTYNTEKLKAELNLRDEKIIFYATPDFNDDPNHIKGGYYVLKLAEMLLEENVKIIVAGNYAENLTVPENVILLGKVSDQTRLAQLYSAADVTLITSKKETFSMVCAESLCCATPVVGFKAGGPEAISLPEYSDFVEYGDIKALKSRILSALSGKSDTYKLSKEASKIYSKERMLERYLNIYKSMS